MKKHTVQHIKTPLFFAWPQTLFLSAILVVATVLVYYPSLHYAFQFDDIANIKNHFNIRSNTFGALFFSGSRWISYWIQAVLYYWGGFEPFVYRVFNILLHCINGLLMFFLVLCAGKTAQRRSLLQQQTVLIAFTTALLFLVHPVQTQTVSYIIQGQLEGLALFFILSMALCLFWVSRSCTRWGRLISTLLLWSLAALACGSKEIACTSPLLLILIDWFFIAQGNWQHLKTRLWIHASVLLIMGCLYLYFLKPVFFVTIFKMKGTLTNSLGNVITQKPDQLITTWQFALSQFKVLIHYLWIFVWPIGLSVEYGWMLVTHFFAADCIIPCMLLCLLTSVLITKLRRNHAHLPTFAFLWFFACILPRASIIPSSELLMDYKTYSGSFGMCLLLASGLVWLVTRGIHRMSWHNQHRLALASMMIVALPLGLLSQSHNTIWRSGLEFWGNILKHAPHKARAYNNYGVELSQNLQRYQDSIPYFLKAIALDKNYPDPHTNLAVAYIRTDHIDLAITALQEGIRLQPSCAEAYNNLGACFLDRHDF
ncbi:MAG TPA: tetratricopeptide repeat protein, partial [Candidatus Limnocylindria bacterium]|nr:tetratricopeptide repeat protein [Candidatus Limnocylindria bacterium]